MGPGWGECDQALCEQALFGDQLVTGSVKAGQEPIRYHRA